jgi:hypothetical protein
MLVTITLDEALTAQLQPYAAARHLALDALAVQLLRTAAAHLAEAGAGTTHQLRRLALIRRSLGTALSPNEAAELAALQTALDRRLAPVDDVLLGELARMQQAGKTVATPTP